MTVILEAKQLSKVYQNVAVVDAASFTISKGEVIGFVGLNGAGKSTTINMLLGFIAPTTGEVTMFGEKITLSNASKSHRRIGFATGDMSLFDGMTGAQYLTFVAKSYGMPLETAMYKKLVQKFNPQLDKKLTTLSRGNKQKIALIAAFMTDPELVILDEPSSGLDPLMQQNFIELVREQSAKGTTIFMSSHYLGEVVDACSRILLIKNGKLVKDMPASELQINAGKFVRVVTKSKVKPPKSAENIVHETQDDAQVLEFVYRGAALRLQEWLGSVPHLQDIIINDDTALVAFEELYEQEAR